MFNKSCRSSLKKIVKKNFFWKKNDTKKGCKMDGLKKF